jgi:hypothetical protein
MLLCKSLVRQKLKILTFALNDVKIWHSTANILFTLLYGLTWWSKATKRRLYLKYRTVFANASNAAKDCEIELLLIVNFNVPVVY